MVYRLTPELLVRAYREGIFPMARSRHGPIEWFSPDPRGVLPLDAFHIPHGLRRSLRRCDYRVTVDHAFEHVIHACAAPRPYTRDTWINDQIIEAFIQLHASELAHSVEAWTIPLERGSRSSPELVGGLYGVALGGAFFGESMFSTATDASKICLVHLVERLQRRGFTLLDTQFATPHLIQFGVIELARDDYLKRLTKALRMEISW